MQPPSILRKTAALFLAFALAGTTHASELELRRGDVVCLLGNALAERMQHDGWFELELQARLPELGLSVRNLGFGGDELAVHQRTLNFGKFSGDGMELTLPDERFVPWDRYLGHCGADVVLAFFGYNESFRGAAGLEGFRADLESFVEHVLAQRYGGDAAPRLVLCSSIPHEDTGDPSLPSGEEHNVRIAAYNAAIAEVAASADVPFIDLYGPMRARYAAAGEALTIDGVHLAERGNAALAEVIAEALVDRPRREGVDLDALRAAILEKNRLWFDRYRATDGYNVYGGRSRQVYREEGGERTFSNWDVLQREMDHLDVLVANRDRAIQALANGGRAAVDDSNAPPLLEIVTNRRGAGPDGAHPILGGEEALERMTAAPGMGVELFADERAFPELANPVQMSFDTRGRLWVAVWPTYTHWTPGRERNDKLLVLEDTDGDGRADSCETFAGDLHNPTGFEFWNGGVLLAAVPDLLFLEDTDGDDRADTRERLLHGLGSADTHHSANSFVLGPDGALYFQEGTFHRSQIESVHGPVRNRDGCVWRFEPRTFRVERHVAYDFLNPHGHVFDRWGQDFVTDGTGNENYHALAFSGFLPPPKKHASYFTFFRQRSRPSAATEILSSAHFPAENQGSYLIANVIGFQGIFQYRIEDDGAGFGATEMDPIVQSSDPNFRPVDLEVGPDGALYFLDWHNPLIGHLQHHVRDPSRDAAHGRVYRVTCAGREPLTPAPIAGQPIDALLELLKSPEDRVRYRTRIELSARGTDAVLEAAIHWARSLDPADPEHEHHLLEALWLFQQHDRMDRDLLARLLEAGDPRARAAATRVLRHGRHHVPDALELLAPRAGDAHPRVRLEAVVAASFFDDERAAAVALEALRHPTDRFIDYALGETLRALEPRWKAALRAGRPLVEDHPAAVALLMERVDAEELPGLPRVPAVLSAILTRHGLDAAVRRDAAAELAALSGASPAHELVAAIRAVDAGEGLHAVHVLHELFDLLGHDAPRNALADMARESRLAATRSRAAAAVIVRDGTPDRAWREGSETPEGLRALLEAVPHLADASHRAGLFERIRPLMFDVPAGLAGAGQAGPGTGLTVAFYEPAPPDATRAAFAARTPSALLEAANVTLDLVPARSSDSFGLTFRGTLFAPAAGRYTFTTRSDDGSRLYVGERCVVDNDGPHSRAARSGSIELAAGPHPLLVTYFEAGGDQSLDVSWEGPGFDEEPVPDGVLGRTDATTGLRAAAIRAMAQLPGHAEHKLADAARLVGETSLAPVVELVRGVPGRARPAGAVRPLVDALAAHVAGLPEGRRADPDVGAALELARELAGALPEPEATAALEGLSGLGGTLVVIRTVPHRMLYDVTEFTVQAGAPVSLVFHNDDVMPHNLVITLPGEMATVGEAAERLAAEGANHVPDLPAVLWHTRLLHPGESERIDLVAPEEAGDHPFVCTYPGHWRLMNGTMRVVADLSGGPRVSRREAGVAVAARTFVRDWKVDDLRADLAEGWATNRSREAGRALFDEAGCITCHAADGSGPSSLRGGPPLSALAARYRDAELLTHVLEPSHEVLEGYAVEGFELADGRRVFGRVLAVVGESLRIAPDLLAPERTELVSKADVEERWDTGLSPMPTGLLVTLDRDDVLDLLGHVQASAKPEAPAPAAEDLPWVVYEGGTGPGAGKHVVLLSGDDEYRSEEALPMLGRILSAHHGFRCTVLFATNPVTGEIEPDEQTHIAGMHHLDDADLLVCFLRFRELPDEDMRHFVDYVESGRPIVGIRTATHAFHYTRNPESPYRHYDFRSTEWPGGFGRQVLGETWIAHHGQHGSQSTRGVLTPGRESHPIVRGVSDVWGPTDVYAVRDLPADATILLRGQVLDGMEPGSPPAAGPQNDPMMPLVWLRELEKQRVVCSTIGAATDCESEGLRRLLVNACYWGLGLEESIPAESRVDVVGDYAPTAFGFGTYLEGVRPSDHR